MWRIGVLIGFWWKSKRKRPIGTPERRREELFSLSTRAVLSREI
jgi:hypothetical protein